MKRCIIGLMLAGALVCSAQTPGPDNQANGGQSSNPGNSDFRSVQPDSTKLLVSNYVRPIYPAEAEAKRIEGLVTVHLDVDEEGNVIKAEAVSGDELLKAAAVAAFKQWKFRPYIHNGHAVKVSTTLPMQFSLPLVTSAPDVSSELTAKIPPANPQDTTNPSQPTVNRTTIVRVSNKVSQGFLIHTVRPEYPAIARSSHREGTVILRAIIGKDGRVKNLTRISGDQVFADPAMVAVKQWIYRPYMLDGAPVEVDTEITVNFFLRH